MSPDWYRCRNRRKSRAAFWQVAPWTEHSVCEPENRRCRCTGGDRSWWVGSAKLRRGRGGSWLYKRELSPLCSTESVWAREVLVHDLQPDAGADSGDDRRRARPRLCRFHGLASTRRATLSASPHRCAECLRPCRPVVDEQEEPVCLWQRTEGAPADALFGVERKDKSA